MTPPRVYRTEGIVLKGFDYGEADRIVTLFTPHLGKIRAVAKGVRKTKSRMSGHIDLFTRSNLLLARGRQLDIVTQADSLEVFRPMRDDLWRSSWCHYVAELIDGFMPDALANYPVYSLALVTLRRISTSPELEMTMRSFELQLLALTGYRPQLHRCLHCNSEVRSEINRFSSRLGGVLCPLCGSHDMTAPTISVQALKVMRNLQLNEGAMMRVNNLEDETHREVERRLLEYLTFRLETRPRSIGFLDRLRTERIGS